MEFYKIKLKMEKEKAFTYDNTKISQPKDVVKLINSIETFHLNKVETVASIAMSTKNEILAYAEIGGGTINTCITDIPSIFKVVLTANAKKFILVHNHPSGDSTPSKSDIEVTKNIKTAAEIMQLEFIDHIVIGDNTYTSILAQLSAKGGEIIC